MLIAVVNESTTCTPDEARAAVDAIVHQLRYHLAPTWGHTTPALVLYPDEASVPPLARQLVVILDDADQAGALGYHDETPSGRPYSRTFWHTAVVNGVPGSSVLSHEVLEQVVNPSIGGWEFDGSSTLYAREVADPVESDLYEINGVAVSNFVTSAWFDPQAPPGSRFDWLGQLSAPFTVKPDGYVIVMGSGRESSHFGPTTYGDAYPEWRKATKIAGSRTARLLRSLG